VVFSSLLFLYAFFPLSLAMTFFPKGTRAKNAVLLGFSLLFYTWGEPVYLFLLLGMVFVNYGCGLMISRMKNKKMWLILAVAASLVLLGIFKYGAFAVENISALLHIPAEVPKIILPIGISFYTFQALSYTIDVYRGEVPPQKNFAFLLMYVSLFHQCVAGPIVRYRDVAAEIENRRTSFDDLCRGITRFSVGLGKKVLLANVCGSIADSVLLSEAAAAVKEDLAVNVALLSDKPALLLWLGVLAYMLQIYLDFSAYSDMAIGMGLMVGFHYKENFDYPYAASSVTMFWRKWHISLSSFFRDYVYFPLGGSRVGKYKTIRNMFVVWALTGLWHGASWNFVLWGLYFFLLLSIEKLGLLKLLGKLPKAVGHIYLLLAAYFGWILFRFRQLPLMWTVVKGLFGGNENGFTDFEASTMWKNYIFLILAACVACTPLIAKLGRKFSEKAEEKGGSLALANGILQAAVPVLLLVLSTIFLVGNSYNPFIYYQF